MIVWGEGGDSFIRAGYAANRFRTGMRMMDYISYPVKQALKCQIMQLAITVFQKRVACL